MKRYLLLLPLAGVLATMTLAQPPDGRKGPANDPTTARVVKVDPKVEAWLKTLAEKITDPHDEIRDSARTGLVAAGTASLPTLRQILAGDDTAKITAARKLIEAIELPELQKRAMMAQAGMGIRAAMAPSTMETPRSSNATDRPNAGRPDGNRPNEGADKPNDGKPRPGPDGRPPNPFENIINDLKLEERQAKQAQEVMEEFRDRMNALRKQVEEEKLTREESRPKREELQQAMMKDMKAILGDKFEKFEEAMKNMPKPGPRGDRPERGDGPKPPQPPQD